MRINIENAESDDADHRWILITTWNHSSITFNQKSLGRLEHSMLYY